MDDTGRDALIRAWAKKAVKNLTRMGWNLDIYGENAASEVEKSLRNARKNDCKSGLDVFLSLTRQQEVKDGVDDWSRLIPSEVWPNDE